MTGKSKIALAMLIAVMFTIHFYISRSPIGIGYIIAQTTAFFAIVACFAGAIAHFTKSKFRGDITLALTLVMLIMSNRSIIVDTYDVRKFQTEAAAVGPDKLMETIQRSNTRYAATARGMQAISTESAASFEKLLNSLDDPALDGPFLPEKVMDIGSLRAANAAANAKITLLADFGPKAEEIFSIERHKFDLLLAQLSSQMRKGYLGGIERRHTNNRSIFSRRVAGFSELMNTAASTSQFLLDRQGQYSLSADGVLLFESDSDSEEFNRLVTKLNETVNNDQALVQEGLTLAKSASTEMWSALSSSQ
ncbi:hypothetical protein [Phyllobacterium sp. SB3]|uniref:hypothetical protein n=1 Tax=Phyllobacterium sp. SB3 TaxID=3156073 RepID=UPI0032AFF989